MRRLLTLEEARTATGQPETRLRWWCATGRLRCEKDGDDWEIPVEELTLIDALLEERERAIAAGLADALVVPVENASIDLHNEVARRLGLPTGAVTTSKLALDGTEYVLAVWKADGPSTRELTPVVELAEELGGDVLDGEGRP